jgi:two-component system LytT family sensor kinase
MADDAAIAVALVVAGTVVAVVLWRVLRGRRAFGTVEQLATYAALHQASLAAPPLREGLTATAAGRSARHLRTLLASPAVALTDTEQLLAWEGAGETHSGAARHVAAQTLQSGRPAVVNGLTCSDAECPLRSAVVAPLVLDERVVGTLTAYGPTASPRDDVGGGATGDHL